MDSLKQFFLLLMFLSGVVFNYADVYSDIRVAFPEDPCDLTEIEMPDFNAPKQRISETRNITHYLTVYVDNVVKDIILMSNSSKEFDGKRKSNTFKHRECLEYTWRLRYEQGKMVNDIRCLEKQGRTFLLGGTQAIDGEYPHMAALGWKAKVGTWIFKCGSSLISEKYTLTAAHCSQVKKNDNSVAFHEPKIVRLGSKSIADYNGWQPANDVGIKKVIVYPRYNPPKQYFDIALVELEDEVSFRWLVHPACLWTSFENPDSGILTGWGVVDTSTLKSSTILQKAEIRIVDSEECNKTLIFKRNRNWWGIMRHQLCAGEEAGRIDTCQGDSGGPLQSLIPLDSPNPVFRWSLHKIVGVTSFGFGCAKANTPGLYTRVTSFLGWIESIVWPENIIITFKEN